MHFYDGFISQVKNTEIKIEYFREGEKDSGGTFAKAHKKESSYMSCTVKNKKRANETFALFLLGNRKDHLAGALAAK